MSDSWQDLFSTWKSRMAFLYGKLHMTDCKLILGEGEDKLELRLHKMVLSSCSTEFSNLWFLSGAINHDDITIRDVSKKALTAFVYYLYNENAELSMDIVWDVLKLAKLYGVKSLTSFCGVFLESKVNGINFLSILEKLKNYDFEDVQNQCLYLWSCSSNNIYENSKFYSISQELLKKLIDFNDFPGTELEVYKGIMKWTEKQCEIKNIEKSSENRRLVLGNCVQNIIFNNMTVEEFKSIDDDQLFLTQNERLAIYRNLHTQLVKLQIGQIMMSDDKLCRTDSAKTCMIFFSVDRSFILHGIYIFGATTKSVENIDFSLLEDRISDTVELAKERKQILYDGSPKKYLILLNTPIIIHERKNYCLTISELRECERFCATAYSREDFSSFSCFDEKIIRGLLLEEIV